MIAFIKDYNISSIKKKLLLLYILNVTDILFTIALLQTGFFRELNVLMVNAVENPFISFILKIILPALLLIYLYKRIDVSEVSQLKAANIGINISLTLYTLVNISHVIWVLLLPFFYSIV